MRAEDPRFSIFVPVRNGAPWLGGAIESVLAQTYPHWELVVGDNASTDNPASVVAKYQDDRIRIHRWETSVDIFPNWNRTMRLCRYEWVQALSADDRLRPRCLELMADRIQEARATGRRLAMVLTKVEHVDPEGRSVGIDFYGYRGVASVADGFYRPADWLRLVSSPGNPPWNFGSVAINRSVIDEMGYFYREDDPSLMADLELAIRVSAFGDVAYIDVPLLDVVEWGGNDTRGRFARNRAADEELTPLGAAYLSGLAAHERRREVTAAERDAVLAAVARTHVQRAAAHRYQPGGRGRRAAFRDILRAFRYSPRTMIGPRMAGYAVTTLALPGPVISRLRHALLGRRARRLTAAT